MTLIIKQSTMLCNQIYILARRNLFVYLFTVGFNVREREDRIFH